MNMNDTNKGVFDFAWDDRYRPFSSRRKYVNYFDVPPEQHQDINGVQRKMCRGQNCGCLLPLSDFMRNRNMPDGYDLYCIRCNQRKRAERNSNKPTFESAFYFSGDYANNFNIPEAFEKDVPTSAPLAKPLPISHELDRFRKQSIITTITQKITDAKLRYKKKINLCEEEVHDRLFNGNFHCLRNNKILTQECFMHHHLLTIVVDDSDVDIVVSECICASALETQGFVNIQNEVMNISMERQIETRGIVDNSSF